MLNIFQVHVYFIRDVNITGRNKVIIEDHDVCRKRQISPDVEISFLFSQHFHDFLIRFSHSSL
jgi:hypothetical protein